MEKKYILMVVSCYFKLYLNEDNEDINGISDQQIIIFLRN